MMENTPKTAPTPPSERIDELEKTCFVIMPFGKKEVGGKEVDFTAIYHDIFEPAIGEVRTLEDQPLVAKRTDMDAFSGSINQDMFEYIMYSRMAFADISGFNPNVFYEIGARHSAQESGTVVFRQTGHEIPYDINSIKVFEYDHESGEKADASRDFITGVLSETLKRNRLDSPVRLALRAQWGASPTPAAVSSQAEGQSSQPVENQAVSQQLQKAQWEKQAVEGFMRDAEEALRLGDLEMARIHYWGALRFDPMNIIARMRLGLTLKREKKHYEALEEFTTVTKLAPGYGEAWREKGIAEGLIARKIPAEVRPEMTRLLPDGFDSLTRATRLIPEDFDAWSSLGGVLKNVRGDLAAARQKYAHASKISDGHPYPLLNGLKIEALHTGELNLEPVRAQLEEAKKLRLGQILATPPADTPWCYFDLAEIHLYQNDKDGFMEYVKQGIESAEDWAVKSFRDTLNNTLVAKGIEFDGLSEGIALLDKAIAAYATSEATPQTNKA
uniref:Uncharacterized protein n=1 Tax=Candidatus Kentrum sp. FW TaxID=2126338 RepID=A0A450TII4_9GAMM|nr:MAG: hypothetical protein BECKFW1821B_GA0114236_112513 [Candidatus Kentron sp. FW]